MLPASLVMDQPPTPALPVEPPSTFSEIPPEDTASLLVLLWATSRWEAIARPATLPVAPATAPVPISAPTAPLTTISTADIAGTCAPMEPTPTQRPGSA